MAGKPIPFSVRLPESDAAFLAELRIEGASTPSEKIRAIISQARNQHEGERSFTASLENAQNQINPAIQHIREIEDELGVHSELVARTLQWLPEVLAVVATHGHNVSNVDQLEKFETRLSKRLFDLSESLLQLAMTDWSGCYSKDAQNERLKSLLELARIVTIAKEK